MEALDVSAPGFLHSVPAAMQALSSIGRVAPAVFAQHAAAVANFVLEVTGDPAPVIIQFPVRTRAAVVIPYWSYVLAVAHSVLFAI